MFSRLAACAALIAVPVMAQTSAAPASPTTSVQASQPTPVASAVNALMVPSKLPLQYPAFDQIKDSDFAPAIEAGMAEHLREVEAIVNNPAAPTFENTIEAMERSGQLLRRASTILFNLIGTDTNPARQKLQADYAARLAAHSDAISLNPKLFVRIKTLNDQLPQLKLDPEQRRLVERTYKRFVRAGALLPAEQQARIKVINGELAELGARFSEKVLAEVNDSAVLVDTEAELAGLSKAQVAAASAAAEKKGHKGKFLIALLNTTDQPVLSQLENRATRERVFKASIARGSRGNAHDTTGIIAQVVKLRAEAAQMLGYASHADYVLEEGTAKTKEAVNGMLTKLAPAAVAAARREGVALQAHIDAEQRKLKQPTFQLQPWDWSFYANRVRKAKYGFDENEIKPYLEMTNVLEKGVFFAANKVYGLSFKRRTDLPTYHPDVLVYDVFDADGSQLAIFVADMYARSTKRGGAWMNAYVSQSDLLGTQPVIANHLNITKPPAGEPTLMTWDEVNTTFHEFGHALHGMFSKVKYPSFAGTAVPRDFVEYPSQVNEMWATWPEVLANYAQHYQTGKPMPKALLQKIEASGAFNEGFKTTAYLSAAMLDQRLHQLSLKDVPSADQIVQFEKDALAKDGFTYEAVLPRYRTAYFSHIMGGYSAGYYAYIWSEVLDSNTVDWYKAHGGMKRELGDQFRAKLLSRGGSKDALQLFRDVVGHEPQIEPLLKRRGLAVAAEGRKTKPAKPAREAAK